MNPGAPSAGAAAAITRGIASPDSAAAISRRPSASRRNRSGAHSAFHFAKKSPAVVATRDALWMHPPPTGRRLRTLQVRLPDGRPKRAFERRLDHQRSAFEQVAATRREHREDVLEAVLAAVVGIGDVGAAARLVEVAHEADLVALGPGRALPQLTQMAAVHGQDQVEVAEVRVLDRAGDGVDDDAVLLAHAPRARDPPCPPRGNRGCPPSPARTGPRGPRPGRSRERAPRPGESGRCCRSRRRAGVAASAWAAGSSSRERITDRPPR